MSADYHTTLPVPIPTNLESLERRAADYAVASLGAGTKRAYNTAWRQYQIWCAEFSLDPFNDDNIPLYVTRLADLDMAVSTIQVALAGIAAAYRWSGLSLDLRTPKLATVIEGVRRKLGAIPRRQAAPISVQTLRLMLEQCSQAGSPALVARNRAMMLIGFGAALRRSELVDLRLGDAVLVSGKGITIHVRRSKTDQRGEGQSVAIWANQAEPDFCPAMALRDWLNFRKKGDDKDAEDFEDRPLFCSIPKGGRITGEKLSDKAVVRLVKDLARLAGYGDEVNFSGHSLRSGLVTVAAEAGAELPGVMRQARHTAPATTMRYYRPSDLWKNNVTAGIFRE